MMQQYLCGCGNFINFSLCAVTFVFVPTCPPSTSVLFLEYDKTKYRFMLLYICELDLKESSVISHFSILLGDHHPLQLGAAEDEEDTGGDDHDEDRDQDGEEDIPPGAGDIQVGDHWGVRRL